MGSSSLNSLLNRQDPIRVVWLRRSEWKHCVFLVLSVASLGVFYCLCILYPKWRMTVEMCECSAEEATIGISRLCALSLLRRTLLTIPRQDYCLSMQKERHNLQM